MNQSATLFSRNSLSYSSMRVGQTAGIHVSVPIPLHQPILLQSIDQSHLKNSQPNWIVSSQIKRAECQTLQEARIRIREMEEEKKVIEQQLQAQMAKHKHFQVIQASSKDGGIIRQYQQRLDTITEENVNMSRRIQKLTIDLEQALQELTSCQDIMGTSEHYQQELLRLNEVLADKEREISNFRLHSQRSEERLMSAGKTEQKYYDFKNTTFMMESTNQELRIDLQLKEEQILRNQNQSTDQEEMFRNRINAASKEFKHKTDELNKKIECQDVLIKQIIQKYEKDITDVHNSYLSKNKEIDTLKIKLNSYELESIENKQITNNNHQNNIQEVQIQYQTQIDKLNQQLKEKEKQFNEHQKQNQKLQQDMQLKVSQTLDSSEKQIFEVKQQNQKSLLEQHQQQQKINKEQEKQLTEFKYKSQLSSDQIQSSMSEQINKLSQLIKDQETQLFEVMQKNLKIPSLEEQLNVSKIEQQSMKNNVLQLKDKLWSISKKKLADFEQFPQNSPSKNITISSICDDIFLNQSNVLMKLESQLNGNNVEMDLLNRKIQLINESQNESQIQIKNTQQHLLQQQQQTNELKTNYEEEIRRSKLQIQQVEKELSNKIQELNEKNNLYQQSLHNKDNEIFNMKVTIQRKDKDQDSMQQKLEKIATDLQTKYDQTLEIQKQDQQKNFQELVSQKQKNSNKYIQIQNISRENEIYTLQQELDLKKSESEETKSQNSSIKNSHNEALMNIESLNAQINELQDKIDEQAHVIKSKSADLQNWKSQSLDLEQEAQILQKQNDHLLNELEDVQKRIENGLVSMYGHNRREIEEAFNMRDHFELENHRLSVIIDDLTMEMNLIKKKTNELSHSDLKQQKSLIQIVLAFAEIESLRDQVIQLKKEQLLQTDTKTNYTSRLKNY